MAYETTRVVKTLRFPGNTSEQYEINAVALSGLTRQEIEQRFNTLESFDALRYMGTLSAGATLPAASKGDVYKVISKGEIAGAKVEIGDMLICNKDGTAENTPANWDIIQANVDIDAILDHYHTGNVTFTKSDKSLTHEITAVPEDLTATFKNGSASVNGGHGHTASGTVKLTPGGSVQEEELTPAGTVKITTPTTKGGNDVTVKPSGEISEATTVTNVQAGNTTVSAHVVTSVSSEGAHECAGTVNVENATAGGSVESHNHNVTLSTTPVKKSFFNTATYKDNTNVVNPSYTGFDGILEFGVGEIEAIASASVTEEDVAPTFTGTPHNHTARFNGGSIPAHTHTITIKDHDVFVPVINVTSEPHSHEFEGTEFNIHADFTGTPATHTHVFTGTENTWTVDVDVEDFTGNFSGTASGDVEPSLDKVVTSVSIANHSIATVDSGSFTTGTGKQD